MKKPILFFFHLLLIFSSNFVFAQYTQNDSSLVRTTFQREFDKNIINEYLSSKGSNKVNAALLSISHSEDTTFVDSIIKLNFNKYGDLIAFALGQLGESKKSEEYLLNILDSTHTPLQTEVFKAIGKCGDSLTLEYLFESVINDSLYSSVGFPFALTNFHTRGVENINTLPYLINQLSQPNISQDELFQVLYALYRIGPSHEAMPKLMQILNKTHPDSIIQYTLNNLRKLKSFAGNRDLITQLTQSDSWNVRTEASSVLCYYPYESYADLEIYLSLILDVNPNVSRTAATSLKNIRLNNFIRDSLESFLERNLTENKLSSNIMGELFISYSTLFPKNLEDNIDEYEDIIEPKFIYRTLTKNYQDTDFNYDYLTDKIENSSEVELLDLLPAMLVLQNRFLNEDDYFAIIFKLLNGNKPSSISIICDGLKLPVIHHYQEMLQEIIIDQVFRYRNNPQYIEALFSLANIAVRINKNFHFTVIDLLSQSSLYSVQKFTNRELGINLPLTKYKSRFYDIWKNSFQYSMSKIITTKGIITISLKPEIAPMTVGNYVSLAENNFYNDVLFHRVVPDFVIQAGDTLSTGWGGPGYEIVTESSPRPFIKGAVGMASAGKDTEGSQWFIMHSYFPHLNGRYTNWATVIKGQNVVDIIDEGDMIIEIELLK